MKVAKLRTIFDVCRRAFRCIRKMLKRKLSALDYPDIDTFDVHNEDDFRRMVLWLEDQKVRHYKVEDRSNLRNNTDPNWNKTFERYLNDLGCPLINASPLEQLCWLSSLAVRLEYSDNVDKYNKAIVEKKQKQTSAPNVVSKNPLDNLDFSSNAFNNGIAKIANLTCVGPHPDPRVRLSALTTIINTAPHPHPAGQNTETVETPMDVMDLLFVSELRYLQTTINETLVAVQKITANPKTDTTLGKVGF